ncbi:MAG: hypothetical protein ABJA50_11885, partial [Chloroflexota bacterium]
MNFRNLLLILRREYLQRVRSPGFIIGTVVGILGLAALAFVPAVLGLLDQGSTAKVAVVDQHDIVYSTLELLSKPTPTPVPGSTNSAAQTGLPAGPPIKFSKATSTDPIALDAQVAGGEITAYLIVEGDK